MLLGWGLCLELVNRVCLVWRGPHPPTFSGCCGGEHPQWPVAEGSLLCRVPGESLHGYRICIQALLLDRPKIATTNLGKVSRDSGLQPALGRDGPRLFLTHVSRLHPSTWRCCGPSRTGQRNA